MSTGYMDERVVSMKFDNRDFERNVHESLGTIDKLKKSLDFKGATESMEELSEVAEKTDLSPLLKGLSKATDGFSALEVIGITALSRITNKVMEVGERLVKSLTVDQLAAGWNKYEQKVTAVQTIMAATNSTWQETARRLNFAGTQMEFVNEQLNKLNWFSDETSYSFTDMTSNIGKFTSSGVELDKAVTAMEGISVWAAKSGVNAQNATRAYYNLAQAMSVGAVKLIDWKSIENANMATIEFKQTAIDTAVKMGTLKKAEKGVFKTLKGGEVTVTNFNEKLKDEWFTADVLTATLEEYGKAATRLSEIYEYYGIYATEFLSGIEDWSNGNADIIDIADELGVSVEELLPLFEELSSEEYKLSMSAFRAAQEAKTFTEVLDATKDAVSTQWMNTWELIFGNYEEAKKLWSEMAEKFFEIFAGGGEKRNNMLKTLLGDSWDMLIDRIKKAGVATDVFEKQVITNMKNAGLPVDEMLETWGSLGNVIRNNSFLMKYVKQAINELLPPVDESGKMIAETTKKLEDFQKVVNEVIRGDFNNGKKRIDNLTEAGWNYAEVQDLVNKVWARNGQTWKDTTITAEDLVDTLSKMTTEELRTINFTDEEIKLLQKFRGELDDTGSDLNFFLDSLTENPNTYKSGRALIFESLINVVDAFARIINVVKDAWSEVFPNKNLRTLRRYLEIIHSITEWLVMNDETYDKIKRTLAGVFSIMGLIQDILTTALKILLPDLFNGAEKIGGGILDITANLGDALVNIRKFLTSGELLGNIIKYLRDMFFASLDSLKNFVEYLSELPIIGAIFETIGAAIEKVVGFFKELWDIFYNSIIEEDKTAFEAIVKVFERLVQAFKDLEEKYPIIKDVKEAIADFFDKFKEYGENILSGLIEGFTGFKLDDLKKEVENLAKTIYDTFATWMGIHSPSTKFIELAINCVAGFIVGIIEGTIFVITAIKNFARNIDRTIETEITEKPDSPMAKLHNYILAAVQGIKNFFEGIHQKLSAMISNVKQYLDDHRVLSNLEIILKKLLNILFVSSLIYTNIAGATALLRFSKAIREIGSFFQSWAAKNYSIIIRNIGLTVAAIGGVVYLLARLNPEQFAQAEKALHEFIKIVLILSIAIGVIYGLSKIPSKKGGKVTEKEEKKASTTIIQLAGLILSIGAACWLLINSTKQVMDMIDNDTSNTFFTSLAIIVGMVVLLISGANALTQLSASGIGKTSHLIGVAAIIGVIGLCISSIMNTIYKYFIEPDKNGKRRIDLENEGWKIAGYVATIAGIILALGTAAGIITKMSKGTVAVFGLASTIVAMSIAVLILVHAMQRLSESFVSFGNIITVIGIIAALTAAAFMLIAIMKAEGSTSVFSGLFGVSLFVLSIAGALTLIIRALLEVDEVLSKMKNIGASIFIVISVLSLLLGGATLIGGFSQKEALWTYVGMAVVVAAFSYALYELAKLKMPDNIAKITDHLTIAMGVMFFIVGLANVLTQNATYGWEKVANTIGQLAGIALVIYSFGETVCKLAEIPWDTLEPILDAVSGTLYILLGIVYGIETLQAILSEKFGLEFDNFGVAASLIALGAGVWAVGEGISHMIEAVNDSGDQWLAKLSAVIGFILLLILALGVFIGVLGEALKGSEGTLLAIAAVIAAIALLVFAIGVLLDAIAYFTEHETLTKIFQKIVAWIDKIIDKLLVAIEYLAKLLAIMPGPAGQAGEFLEDVVNYKQGKDNKKSFTGNRGANDNAKVSIKSTTNNKEKTLPSKSTTGYRSTITKYTPQKVYAEGPTLAVQTITNPNNEHLKTAAKVASKVAVEAVGKKVDEMGEEIRTNPLKVASKVNNKISGAGLPGVESKTNIFDIPENINNLKSSYESMMKVYNSDLTKEVIGDITSGEGLDFVNYIKNGFKEVGLSDETTNMIINEFESVGTTGGIGFNNSFFTEFTSGLTNTFGGDMYTQMMKEYGDVMGSAYGTSFFNGYQSTYSEELKKAMDEDLSNIMGSSVDSLNGRYKAKDISYSPNYGVFGSGYGFGFGSQEIKFPDTMEVTSKELSTSIATNAAILNTTIANLNKRISSLYVRLDTGALVGNLTPYISREIKGYVDAAGR